jgi:hypothetical protein
MVEISNSPNFDAIFFRIKEETGIKSVRQLAGIIGKTHPTISAAKAKDNFSASWAFEIEKKFGLLTRWIMTGEGPKRLKDVPQNRRFEMLNEFEEWLSEEVRRNPERKIWFEIHLLDSFQKFAEWKLKRDEKESGGYSGSTRKVA